MINRVSPKPHLPPQLAQPRNHRLLLKTLNDDHNNFNQLKNPLINYTYPNI